MPQANHVPPTTGNEPGIPPASCRSTSRRQRPARRSTFPPKASTTLHSFCYGRLCAQQNAADIALSCCSRAGPISIGSCCFSCPRQNNRAARQHPGHGGSATLLPGAFRWNLHEQFRRSYRDALSTLHLTLCICRGVPISRRHLRFMATAWAHFWRQSRAAASPPTIGFAASAADRRRRAASPPPAKFRPTTDARDGPRVLAGGAISFRASPACTASASEAGARRMVVGGTTRARTSEGRRD